MNESSCSSAFQTQLRKALPACEVIKHRDGSMVGMVDASFTYGKKTLWCEYKFICPTTKGVRTSDFNSHGYWSCPEVAEASATQVATARRLATAGHCFYVFWVVDYKGLRKRVAYIRLWHPITGETVNVKDTNELVYRITQFLKPDGSPQPEAFTKFFQTLNQPA